MIDILKKVIINEINEEEASNLFEKVVEKFHEGGLVVEPKEELCLNEFEWTAVCHGIDFRVLADWRYNGWPKCCNNCNAEIDYKKYGWIIQDNHLIGLSCC